MRLLLIGNHTCGNRGDAAILRGLAAALEQQLPGVELTITSRYPTSSAYLLQRPVVLDLFAAPGRRGGRLQRLMKRWRPWLLWLAADPNFYFLTRRLAPQDQRTIESLHAYDAVVQVGGSFFVDLYGAPQFETPFAALIANRPLYLIGHSLGPFERRGYRQLMARLMSRARKVALREQESRALLVTAKLPQESVSDGADTAWLVPSPARPQPATSERGKVAITLRELAPFDRRLGITQDEYDRAFAKLIDHIVDLGYDVEALSTCTGIDSYHRDDRMNALRLKSLVREPDRYHVVMDELNDVELGERLSRCRLLVGTRLHSAIIAMNFGTPAIALNYEHKSRGTMRQLDLPECAADIEELLDGRLVARVNAALADLPGLEVRMAAAVARERERARKMVADLVADLWRI